MLVVFLGMLVLLAAGCDGGGWEWGVDLSDLSPEEYDLTGIWCGYIGEATCRTVQISQGGTSIVLVGDRGFHAQGSYQKGKLRLTDNLGNELHGTVWLENNITLYGPDEEVFARLVRQ